MPLFLSDSFFPLREIQQLDLLSDCWEVVRPSRLSGYPLGSQPTAVHNCLSFGPCLGFEHLCVASILGKWATCLWGHLGVLFFKLLGQAILVGKEFRLLWATQAVS